VQDDQEVDERYPDYEGHGSYGVARDPQGSAHTVSLVVRKEEQQGVFWSLPRRRLLDHANYASKRAGR
jgi:hypothetical protein